MESGKIFCELSPLEYKVTLSSDRYEKHIVGESGHIDVLPEDIQKAIRSPGVIYQSSSFPSRDVYFAKTSSVHPPLFVKVAVEVNVENKSGEVVTAFLADGIKGGIDKEAGPKYVGFSNKL